MYRHVYRHMYRHMSTCYAKLKGMERGKKMDGKWDRWDMLCGCAQTRHRHVMLRPGQNDIRGGHGKDSGSPRLKLLKLKWCDCWKSVMWWLWCHVNFSNKAQNKVQIDATCINLHQLAVSCEGVVLLAPFALLGGHIPATLGSLAKWR